MFKRLFAVLSLILLTSVVLARPAGLTRTGYSPVVKVSTPRFCSGFDNPPSPRFDFGTVVRDTADDQSVEPGWSEMPSCRSQRLLRDLPLLVSYFMRSWGSLLLIPR